MQANANQKRDLVLITRIREGDEEAKELLVVKYLPMIKHIVRRHYASFLEFDDLMQEGFIGLLGAIDEYDSEGFDMKFSSFAYMCIIRKVYNVIKQTNGNKHKALNDAISLHTYVNSEESRTMMELVPLDDVWTDPPSLIEAKYATERIEQIMKNHLSLLEYSVAALIVRGLSSREIESLIGVKAKVVDNARTRVKAKLERLLDTYGSLVDPGIPLRVRRRRDLYMSLSIGG